MDKTKLKKIFLLFIIFNITLICIVLNVIILNRFVKDRKFLEIENKTTTKSTPRLSIINNIECKNGNPPTRTSDDTINTILQELQLKYNICISFFNAPSSYYSGHKFDQLGESDLKRLKNYLEIFEVEFNKYPIEFIRNTNLKEVAIVKNNSVDTQSRAAVPDFKNEILFYDINAVDISEDYAKYVLHHEFYHMIEEEFQGDVYFQDPEWNKLNPQTFSYGKSGADCNVNGTPKRITGFVSGYAMCALEEDKAETFSYIMESNLSVSLEIYIEGGDKIIKNKVDYLKSFLREKGFN